MIAVFDSGVGGLSVLREIRSLSPRLDIVYYGDTAKVPYGDRPPEEIMRLVFAAVQRLLAYRPAALVVACNTATTVALESLRKAYPDLPIIGIVPVVKTLAEQTANGRVAVIATPGTLSSSVYTELKEKCISHLAVLEIAPAGWVRLVESGELFDSTAQSIIQPVIEQIREFDADTVALGSTHFPWLRSLIEAALPRVRVLDSGAAVARQLVRVLTQAGKGSELNGDGATRYLVSGDPAAFSRVATRLLQVEIRAEVSKSIE